MLLLVDVNENKSSFMMELLNSFSFAKVQPMAKGKYPFLQKVKNDIDNVDAKKDPYAEVWGIWADRDIDAKTLRKQAWGIEE